MSYYHPEFSTYPTDATSSPLFSIEPLELVVEEVKEPLFIFDLPTDLIVYLGDIEIPSRTFDYLNPLLIDPFSPYKDRLVFYHQDDPEPVGQFSCCRLVIGRPDVITSVLKSTIHYPPNFDIDYQYMTVNRSLRMRQLCDIFEQSEQRSVPPLSFFQGLVPVQSSTLTHLMAMLGHTIEIAAEEEEEETGDSENEMSLTFD